MEWLIQVLKMFADFVPRPVIVTPDQRVVIFLLGRWGLDCPPFWYIIWPIFWSHEIVHVSEQCLECQVVIDGVKTRLEVIYRRADAYKSVTACTDAEERTQAEVGGHIHENGGVFDLDELNASCAKFGVEVVSVKTTETGILTFDIHG